MIKFILLLSMFFFHIVDDYYLQGFLASAKQKSWWEKNAPDNLYKFDWFMALIEHAFSWTFSIHIPVFVCIFVFENTVDPISLGFRFFMNMIVHAIVDDQKANRKRICLIEDQCIHFVQIILTWCYYSSHI
jgi:hypothetical protein